MQEYSHDIVRLVMLDEESPILKRHSGNAREVIVSSGLEGYIFSCGKGLSVLLGAIEKASFSIELLRESKRTARERIAYTVADQIEFAIENYLIRSGAIYDRALIFVNKLLELGIADESIAYVPIVTNSHIISYQLDGPLKKLKKVCTEHTFERNAVIHHRKYSESDFDEISLLHKANTISVQAGKNPPFDSELIENATQAFLDLRTEEFELHLTRILESLTLLFDTAVLIYGVRRDRHKKLAELSGSPRRVSVTEGQSES